MRNWGLASRLRNVVMAFGLFVLLFLIGNKSVYADDVQYTDSRIEITGLNMDVVVGEEPDYIVNWSNNERVRVQVVWTDKNNEYANITEFKAGQKPQLDVVVWRRNEYVIPKDVRLYVNDHWVDCTHSDEVPGGYGYSWILYTVTYDTLDNSPKVPSTIEITDLKTSYQPGEKLDTDVSVNTDKVLVNVSWRKISPYSPITFAQPGAELEAYITLEPKTGYSFTPFPTVKLNGTEISWALAGSKIVHAEDCGVVTPTESSYIDGVGIEYHGDENIEIGKAPDVSFTCHESRVNVDIKVVDKNDGDKEIKKYAAGQSPRFVITATAKDAYLFRDDADIWINSESWPTNNYTYSLVTFTEKGTIYGVKKVDLSSLKKPVHGNKPQTTATSSDSNVSSVKVEWLDSAGKAVSVFEGGKQYKAKFTLTSKAGYKFDPSSEIRLFINGVATDTWNNGTKYTISDGNTKLVATTQLFTCPVPCAVHSYDDGEITTAPDCEHTGVKTFTCMDCGMTRTETVKATGHDYNAPTYTFSTDNKTCTARAVCKKNASHVVSETVNTTSNIKTAATKTNKGITTYTATFKNALFATQTKDVEDIEKLPSDKTGDSDSNNTTDPANQDKTSDQSTSENPSSSANEDNKTEKVDKKQKGTSVSKIKAGKKKLTVTWKKQKAKGIKGYEIQYSTDKNFKKNVKSITISKVKTTSTKIKKLKSKKTYYVRIRTYKQSKSERIYSKWSGKKSVKIK